MIKESRINRNKCIQVAAVIILLFAAGQVDAKIGFYTLLEKIRNSEYIIIVKHMNAEGSFTILDGKRGERTYSQYANYMQTCCVSTGR